MQIEYPDDLIIMSRKAVVDGDLTILKIKISDRELKFHAFGESDYQLIELRFTLAAREFSEKNKKKKVGK